MPSQRRTPRGGPGGNGARGPGQGTSHPGGRSARPRAAGGRTPSRLAEPTPADARPAAERSAARRPRFTGRAAVLVLVLAVLTVSYASSLRAYLEQRSHIGDLKSQILEREASINNLEREKRRWDDPAYVKAQARARFGYLMPGESGFEVIGADGQPLEAQAALKDPSEVIKTMPKAWWSAAWESMELAGDPPPPDEEPADLVDGSVAGGQQ